MSTQRRADMCTTHHHACDCREFAHAQEIEHLRAELAALRARIDGAVTGVIDDNPEYLVIAPHGKCAKEAFAMIGTGQRVALVPLND